MNTTLFNHMIKRYNELSFTHHYLIGFTFKHNIYMVETTPEIFPYVLKLDKAGRGAGYSLRFVPNKKQKLFLMTLNPQLICSDKYFNEKASEVIYNRGEVFEKIITEMHNQKWSKDNVPFTEDGDLTVNEIPYQIKFERATFITEKSLANY